MLHAFGSLGAAFISLGVRCVRRACRHVHKYHRVSRTCVACLSCIQWSNAGCDACVSRADYKDHKHQNFKFIVSLVLQELKMSCGYRLFLDACSDVMTFDVRQVFVMVRCMRQGYEGVGWGLCWNLVTKFVPSLLPHFTKFYLVWC